MKGEEQDYIGVAGILAIGFLVVLMFILTINYQLHPPADTHGSNGSHSTTESSHSSGH